MLSGKTVRLQSSDDKELDMPVEFAQQSILLRNMIAEALPTTDSGTSDPIALTYPVNETSAADDGRGVITLPNITAATLEKVIIYCDYHWHHPTPPATDEEHASFESRNIIIPWDRAFCDVPQETLFALILAANFLEIHPLLDLCCKTVANALRACADPEDIRKYLNIKNDFTPEEEEEIRKDTDWPVVRS